MSRFGGFSVRDSEGWGRWHYDIKPDTRSVRRRLSRVAMDGFSVRIAREFAGIDNQHEVRWFEAREEAERWGRHRCYQLAHVPPPEESQWERGQ